jgi:hypothetical protein
MVKKKKILKKFGGIKKKDAHEKQTTKVLTVVLAVVAVLTIVAMGLPVVFWSQSGNAEVRLDFEKDKHDRGSVDTQNDQGCVLGGSVKTSMGNISDAQADCMNRCKADMGLCLEGKYSKDDGETEKCSDKAGTCLSGCEAPVISLACQDVCAVKLGGCLEGIVNSIQIAVQDEEGAMGTCFTENKKCLVEECALRDETVLPTNYCDDQCERMAGICSSGKSAYNLEAFGVCEKVQDVCHRVICETAKAGSAI